jgi:hypothetical protein
MSLHDAYARLTPFELAFPEAQLVDQLIADITEEASGRGGDPANPSVFITMGSVGAFISTLQEPDAPPESVHQYGALVYHAAFFREEGCPLFVLSAHAARYLVEGAPLGEPVPPTDAGYLQLPQHLFWIAGGEGEAPESIDGLFWTVASSGILYVMAATGVRPDRPGFGTVPVPEAPIGEAADWLTTDARREGGDFTSKLPGADIDGLYEVQAAGEVLKLLARFFAYVESVPEAVVSGDESPDGVDGPPPSHMPYHRIVLDA